MAAGIPLIPEYDGRKAAAAYAAAVFPLERFLPVSYRLCLSEEPHSQDSMTEPPGGTEISTDAFARRA